jgi:hypothetical protein
MAIPRPVAKLRRSVCSRERLRYPLPEALIALIPLPRVRTLDMMVLHRRRSLIEHGSLRSFRQFIAAGDSGGVNDTRVVPARVFSEMGGRVALLEAVQEILGSAREARARMRVGPLRDGLPRHPGWRMQPRVEFVIDQWRRGAGVIAFAAPRSITKSRGAPKAKAPATALLRSECGEG